MSELYAVRWADAHGSDGTLQAHEIDHKPYVYTTVGFLVRTDPVGVSIAFEQGEDGRYRDITFVPREIVLEEWGLGKLRRVVKRGKTKKSSTGGNTPVFHDNLAGVSEEPPHHES